MPEYRNPTQAQADIDRLKQEIAAAQAAAQQGDQAAAQRVILLTQQLAAAEQAMRQMMPDPAERERLAQQASQQAQGGAAGQAALQEQIDEAKRSGNYDENKGFLERLPGAGLAKSFWDTVNSPGSGINQVVEAGKDVGGAVVNAAGNLPGALGYGSIDPKGIDAVTARAKEMSDQLWRERNDPGYQPQMVTAERAAYADPGQAKTYDPNLVQDPNRVDFNPVAAAQLDTRMGNEVRQDQLGVAKQIQAAARGEGPFVADSAYASKQADIERAVAGKAATARGSDRAYARLNAQSELADQLRRAAMDAGTMKAQEIATARGQAVGALGGIRGQDVDQASTQAGLSQQAALEGQRVGVGVSTGNRDALQRAREVNAAAQNTAGQFNTVEENRRASERAAGINQTGQFNAGQVNQVAQGNQGAGLQGAGLDVRRREGLAQGAYTGNDQALEGELGKIGVERGNQENKQKFLGNLIDVGTTIGGAIAGSDERIKTGVKPVSDDAAEKLAKALSFKKFRYRGSEDDGREHVGVMAQDLERDPLGKKFVSQRADGVKQVDYGSLTSALLAAALKGRKEARG